MDEQRSLNAAEIEGALDRWWDLHRFKVYVLGAVVPLVVLALWPRLFVTVHAGERGVLFHRFRGGTVTEWTFPEGFYVIPPWDTVTRYDVRLQERLVEQPVLTREGLQLGMKLSVRYRLRADKLGLLHRRIGPDYFEKVVRPEIQAGLRGLAGKYTAEEVYATKRGLIEAALEASVIEMEEAFVILDDLLIREVKLPESVSAAIEAKVREEQAALAYDFRIQRERKEADRKRVEAEGVRDFQSIVSAGISPALLRWRGIEATLELAKSENAKVIVIGSGKDGLPLILDTAAGERAGAQGGRGAAALGAEAASAGGSRAAATAEARAGGPAPGGR